MKKQTSRFGSPQWLVLWAFGILAVGSVAFAVGNSITNNFYEGSYADQRSVDTETPPTGGDEADDNSLGGGSRFRDSYLYAGSGIFVDNEDGFSIGTFDTDPYTGDATTTDGYRERLAVINLDATSSAVLLNPEDETAYVYDATVRVQTATSTAIAYLIGTTTVNGVDQGATCGATGVCANATAGMASILNTGTSAATTALTTFFKADSQGTDTRDGSGTRFVVPVLDGEYFGCFASTSPAANKTVGGQAVQCQIKYYVIED